MTYPEVYSKLNFEVAIITFFKKDGQIRVMLGTRNLNTTGIKYGFQGAKLGGHDKKCNINNGNIAVFDLVAGDARSFSMSRLVDIQWIGVISTEQQLEDAFKTFVEYEKEYLGNLPKQIDLDSIQ